MSIFAELEKQYYEIDLEYSQNEFKAAARGWHKKEGEFKRKREIDDQAYFVFMFSRLEDKIKRESVKLISKKKSDLSSWKQRAPWDIIPPPENIYFKSCLALLTKKGDADFNIVAKYYDERNSIAHGGGFIRPVSMPTVINDFKRLYKELRC